MIGPGWFSCCVGDKYKGVTAQFVMPSHTKGQPMPGFLGGSDLAVPVGGSKAQAADWISAYTNNASMTALRGIGNIPNTTSLLGNSVNERAAAGAGSCRRRRTGSTWRTATSSAACCRRSSPASSPSSRLPRRRAQHHVHPQPVDHCDAGRGSRCE